MNLCIEYCIDTVQIIDKGKTTVKHSSDDYDEDREIKVILLVPPIYDWLCPTPSIRPSPRAAAGLTRNT